MDYQNRFSKLFGRIFLITGLALLLLGVISLFAPTVIEGWSEHMALTVSGAVFFCQGGVFAAIGAISLRMAYRQMLKAERLTSEGERFEGQIVKIRFNNHVRINRRSPLVVECTYKNRDGSICFAKSGNIWPDYTFEDKDSIRANVWVDPGNPNDYFVEVLSGFDLNARDNYK